MGTPDPSLVRRVVLDGETIVVRRSRPDDAAGLIGLFESLPFDDRYSRFFSAFRPDEEFTIRLAGANQHGACALVAVAIGADGTERIIGESSAWPLANGNGELGMTVASDSRGWLGPYLLDATLEVAAAAGMPNIEAEVLTSNRRMQSLLRDRGSAAAGHDGYLTIRLVIATDDTVPSWPPRDDRHRVLVETPGARWNAEQAARSRGLQVIACAGPATRPRRRPCPALTGQPCPLVEGADAVVVRLPDDDTRSELLAAHRSLHPGVPVCIQAGDEVDVVRIVDRVDQLVDHAAAD